MCVFACQHSYMHIEMMSESLATSKCKASKEDKLLTIIMFQDFHLLSFLVKYATDNKISTHQR